MAASAASIFKSQLPINKQTAPVSSNRGCKRIAPVTHQDQAISGVLLSPWRLCRPRRTLVPLRVQLLESQIRGCRLSAPIPYWLTLQAIRFVVRATANGIPFRLVAGAPDPIAGLAVAVVTHAKQRPASKGFCSFNMW
jgi:hypothetical protein